MNSEHWQVYKIKHGGRWYVSDPGCVSIRGWCRCTAFDTLPEAHTYAMKKARQDAKEAAR